MQTQFSWKELFHRLFSSSKTTKEKDTMFSSKHGIVLGAYPKTHDLLVDRGYGNVLVVGPPLSGKGIGTVIPTAFCWNEDAFFFDSTGKLWEETSGFRKSQLHQKVLKFEPMADYKETLHWNPLAEVRLQTPSEGDDMYHIASLLLDPEEQTRTEEEWEVFQKHVESLRKILLKLLYQHKEQGRATPCLSDLLNVVYALPPAEDPKQEEEQAYLKAALLRYQDVTLLKNTTYTDFHLEDIIRAKEPMSFYLVSHLQTFRQAEPILKLFVTLLTDRILEKEAQKEPREKRLLLVLDDFLHLSRIQGLPLLLVNAKELGVLCLLTAQSIEDIEGCYKGGSYLLDACKVQIYHKPDREHPATADHILRLLKDNGPEESKTLTKEQIFQMNANKEFIFLDWYPALLADRFRYYLYSDFVLSSKLPTPSMEACSTKLLGAKPSQNAQDGATF